MEWWRAARGTCTGEPDGEGLGRNHLAKWLSNDRHGQHRATHRTQWYKTQLSTAWFARGLPNGHRAVSSYSEIITVGCEYAQGFWSGIYGIVVPGQYLGRVSRWRHRERARFSRRNSTLVERVRRGREELSYGAYAGDPLF